MVGRDEGDQRTSPGHLWKDARTFRNYFTWGGFVTALILGFTFSALDTGSDIIFAEQDYENLFSQVMSDGTLD